METYYPIFLVAAVAFTMPFFILWASRQIRKEQEAIIQEDEKRKRLYDSLEALKQSHKKSA